MPSASCDPRRAIPERPPAERGPSIPTGSESRGVETTANRVEVVNDSPRGPEAIEAETMRVAIGVTGQVEGRFDPSPRVELFKDHIKADPNHGDVTTRPGSHRVPGAASVGMTEKAARDASRKGWESLCMSDKRKS